MRKPSKFGKYLLLDRIAVGGMAEVFVAKAFGVEGFERLLAIKKILPTMGEDPEFISMFVDEARIAVQLSHANIVQILELGKHDENLYIAMEYIAGRDVRQVLERFRKKGRPMPVPVACLIIAKVCEALDYAHRKLDARGSPLGIVHRDVSPQNVLVSYDGDVKLIDFGIAKAESRLQKTQAGILKGKFSYMSPEQVRGQPIDHRSDVFAVGVVLWELLTGEKLFTGDSDFAVLEKVRQGLVPAPRQLNPAIPEALQTVVMKALKAEVAERYQWASELHDDLMRFCLAGDMMYGSRQLAEWLREEFQAEAEREQERLRVWMGASIDPSELTPPGRTLEEVARNTDPEPRPAAVPDRKAEPPRKSPPTLHDRPAGGGLRASAMATAPELPSLKAGLAATSPTPTDNDRARRSDEFRVPRDADTLAAPPTPPHGTPRASPAPSIFSKPDPAALAALDKTPSAALSLQELPTMKMDGDVLAAAERALLAREADAKAAAAPAPARIHIGSPRDVEEETTNIGPPRPLSEPSMKVTVPGGVFAAMVASSLPPPRLDRPPPPIANGSGSPERPQPSPPKVTLGSGNASPSSATIPESRAAVPAVAMPAAAAPAANAADQKPTPLSLFDEPTRTLPLQLPKPEENAARERREQAEAEAKRAERHARRARRIVIGGLAAGVLGLVALYVGLKPEPRATGTLVVSVKPSVPAELILDGKPVGSAPWVGRGIAAGDRQLEIRAQGFKTQSRTVTVKADPRPLEVTVELTSDTPPPLVAPDVVLNNRARPPAPPAREAVERKPEREAQPSGGAGSGGPAPSRPDASAAPDPAQQASDLANRDRSLRARLSEAAAAAARREADARLAAAPEREPEPAEDEPAPAEDAATPEGPPPKLRITTDPPGATVMVDGKLVGKSPVVAEGLDPSHYHAVAATLDGYAPGRRAAKLEATGTTLMHLLLQRRPEPEAQKKPTAEPAAAVAGPVGYLIAATSPVARVTIDGRETGRWTPVPPSSPIVLPAGDHTVLFVTGSGQKLEEKVTIEPGKTKSLIRKLR